VHFWQSYPRLLYATNRRLSVLTLFFTMTSPSLTLIVAATRTNAIGKAGALPWRLLREMAYFAKVTTDAPEGARNAVVMGRKTWESIPRKFRPLRRRTNVVVSRNQELVLFVCHVFSVGLLKQVCSEQVEGSPTTLVSSVTDAILSLSAEASTPIHRAFLIGGAGLYEEYLQLPANAPGHVDRILLTRVLEPAFEDCDVFLTDFASLGEWKRAEHKDLMQWVGTEVPEGEQEEGEVKYEFQMWVRPKA
jgi:dihydrofolate reductase